MTLASALRQLRHHAQAGSGTLRDCRPLNCFLQPVSLQRSACRIECRQSLIFHRLSTSTCSRDIVSSRQPIAPTASISDVPSSVAAQDEQLEWDEADTESESQQQVLVLPPPSHSRVKTADFVKSSTAVSQCPPSKHPEFAVIGRSNVGKSSLINMLTGKKALAQISKTPGKLLSSHELLRCVSCCFLQDLHNNTHLGKPCVSSQARQSASTISSSTTPGFWLTSQDMGKCSLSHPVCSLSTQRILIRARSDIRVKARTAVCLVCRTAS